MVGEDDRAVGGEERIEPGVGHAVRMLVLILQTHQVDDVDDPDLQLGEILPEDVDRGQRLQGRNVTGAGHDDIRHIGVIIAGPVPDTDAAGTVGDRRIHRQVVQRRLLSSDDDVDVMPAS